MPLITAEGTSYFTRTAEYVGPHPDKLADTISDAIVQAELIHDPNARVAAETLCASDGTITLAGEITSTHVLTTDQKVQLARNTVADVGWNNPKWRYYAPRIQVVDKHQNQSPDIAQGVNKRKSNGKISAGDQGLFVGFAIDEGINAAHFMPVPLALSRDLLWVINNYRREKVPDQIQPDMKSQVTVAYEFGKPHHVQSLVLAVAHADGIEQVALKESMKGLVEPVIDAYGLGFDGTNFLVNNTGRFVIGGPLGDTGLTGRKDAVDKYSTDGSGGGAFSGKDPSKVDRSWAMDARWAAKNIVANGMAKVCKLVIAGVIGAPDPMNITFNTFGTETIPLEEIIQYLHGIDFSVSSSIERHGLCTLPRVGLIYYPDLAANGHFGGHFDGSTDRSVRPWETIVAPENLRTWKFDPSQK